MKTSLTAILLATLLLTACASTPTPTTASSPTPIIPTKTFTPVPPGQQLQLENTQPQTRLSPKRSRALPDNHIGVHFEGFDRYSDTEHVYKNGFKRIRITSLNGWWDETLNTYKTYTLETIPIEIDELITDYNDNGVIIVLDLWMGAGLVPSGTRFQSEEEITQYLEYVRFVVSHFKGRVRHYQIWNEPGHMTVSEYANLISQTVPVIRESDPEAKIIIGATQGDWVNGYPEYGEFQRFSVDIRYLTELLQSGVVDLVDGISWHPFYDNIPTDPYYQNYPRMVEEIKELAESQGFEGEYFADEILWRTMTESNWDGGPPVSRRVGAKYYLRAITMHRGLGTNVTINTFFQAPFLSPIHNLCDTLAGAEPTELSVSIEGDVSNVSHYAFALPEGDKLLAVWENDEAVENDSGISTTLIISDLSIKNLIGVDVFHGFKQELNAETDNGQLVIRNLMVKDYPIIIKFCADHSGSSCNLQETSQSHFGLFKAVGNWTANDNTDGSAMTLEITDLGDGNIGMTWYDSDAKICAKEGSDKEKFPWMAEGSGFANEFILYFFDLTGNCLDHDMEFTHNYFLEYDPETDTLLDNHDVIWVRE
jgi:hypothetical protein